MSESVIDETLTDEFIKKKLITGAYSKSFNSPEFNPILQKFHDMI